MNVAWLAVGTCFLLLFMARSTLAQERNGSIAQGFQTQETNISVGAMVSLVTNDAKSVELATADNANRLVGVIGEKALIELSSESQSVQVVTSGVTLLLVSDINGEVKNGDKIMPSPISGVGMKATESGMIVGTAQADMNSVQGSSRTVQTKEGTAQSVKVAAIPAQVNVTLYSSPNDERPFLPEFLQIFANSVAGREVSPIRVAIAALVLILAVVSIGALLYSSVRSSIISIGRNPLAENAVRKSLWQIALTVGGILLVTVIAIYLILIT